MYHFFIENSSKVCTRGFPDFPVSRVSSYNRNAKAVNLLIPEMNFTRNATIVGFLVAGRNLHNGRHSKIQIWRKNDSQSSVYSQVGSILVNVNNRGSCAAMEIADATYLCILYDELSVQSEDILGLELPNNNDEIFFTRGGPTNYIFGQLGQDSNINIGLRSHNGNTAKQLPQIIFNFTLGRLQHFTTVIIILYYSVTLTMSQITCYNCGHFCGSGFC